MRSADVEIVNWLLDVEMTPFTFENFEIPGNLQTYLQLSVSSNKDLSDIIILA